MAKKRTIEEIQIIFKDNGCKLIDKEYINNTTKIKHVAQCGHIRSITLKKFLLGYGRMCLGCSGIQTYDLINVKTIFKKNGCILLSTSYKNSKSYLKYLAQCGCESKIILNAFLRGQGRLCRACTNKKNGFKKRRDIEFIREQFEKRGYKLVSTKYIEAHSKLKYKCKNGHSCEIKWNSFQQGRGCRICGQESTKDKQKLSHEYVKKFFTDIGYKLLEKEYINCMTKMKFECLNGHIGKISFHKFKAGRRCSKCSESYGEMKIRIFLEKNNIEYVKEKKFIECKDKNMLSFDFHISNKNILIEYQGIQHYQVLKNDFFGGQKAFASRQKRDQIKRDFAKKNNIKLLEIPYWDFSNINKILNKELGCVVC